MSHAAVLENAIAFAAMQADESGEPRLVTRTTHEILKADRERRVPRLRIIAMIDETPVLRETTWRVNPFCCACSERVASPELGGVVPTEEGPRMAHRSKCFAAAMLANQPHMAVRVALGRAGRGS